MKLLQAVVLNQTILKEWKPVNLILLCYVTLTKRFGLMSDLQTFTPLWSCFKLKLFFCLHLVDWDFVCTFQVLLLPGVACSQHGGYSVKEGNRPRSPEIIFHLDVCCEEQDAKSLAEFRSAWTRSPPRSALMLADKLLVTHLVVLPHVKNSENHLGKLL